MTPAFINVWGLGHRIMLAIVTVLSVVAIEPDTPMERAAL
jgi:hypothetical protein